MLGSRSPVRRFEGRFDHLFLQPCYDEAMSVEKNGRSFAITEDVVKNNPDGVCRFKRTNGWVFSEVGDE